MNMKNWKRKDYYLKMIKTGKRYYWFINNYENKIKSGLFTGEYDINNGNAILLTKNGECWSIPQKDLLERKPNNENIDT